MHQLLTSARERFLFALLTLSVLLCLAGARMAVAWATRSPSQSFWDVASSLPVPILDNLIAALISAAVVFLLFLALGGANKGLHGVQVLEASRSNELHQMALRATGRWWHYGHYAGWVRGDAMPALAQSGHQRDTEICVIILDPRLEDLCNAYTRFRRASSTQHLQAEWARITVYAEIYSTILAAQLHNADRNNLHVRVFLRPEFAIYRVDINDEWAALTCIDPREPPIILARDSNWFKAMHSNFLRLMDQLWEIPFLSDQELNDFPVETKANVITLMDRLGVAIPLCLSSEERNKVASIALERWKVGTKLYA